MARQPNRMVIVEEDAKASMQDDRGGGLKEDYLLTRFTSLELREKGDEYKDRT